KPTHGAAYILRRLILQTSRHFSRRLRRSLPRCHLVGTTLRTHPLHRLTLLFSGRMNTKPIRSAATSQHRLDWTHAPWYDGSYNAILIAETCVKLGMTSGCLVATLTTSCNWIATSKD